MQYVEKYEADKNYYILLQAAYLPNSKKPLLY